MVVFFKVHTHQELVVTGAMLTNTSGLVYTSSWQYCIWTQECFYVSVLLFMVILRCRPGVPKPMVSFGIWVETEKVNFLLSTMGTKQFCSLLFNKPVEHTFHTLTQKRLGTEPNFAWTSLLQFFPFCTEKSTNKYLVPQKCRQLQQIIPWFFCKSL